MNNEKAQSLLYVTSFRYNILYFSGKSELINILKKFKQ